MRAFGKSGSVGLSWVAAVGLVALPAVALAANVDFEEFAGPPHSLGAQSYYNGADGAAGFSSGGARFSNSFTDWGGGFTSWAGWSVSSVVNTTTPGYVNQYAAWPGSGAGGSALYGVAYVSAFDPLPAITLPVGAQVQSLQVTNTTYAGLAMRNGAAPAKKFGGDTGTDPDWFKLTITGLDASSATVGTVDFYLADYRFANSASDYIVDTWTTVDLSSLAAARTLRFSLSSSDVGTFGINTPTYLAMDNLTYVPEPAALALVAALVLVARRRA